MLQFERLLTTTGNVGLEGVISILMRIARAKLQATLNLSADSKRFAVQGMGLIL
jgi:hypothetical protein